VAAGAIALVLAFGPTLHTAWGAFPIPYRLLHAFVPGFEAIRTPARFLLYVDLTLALLAGAGAVRLLGRIPAPRRSAAVAALVALVVLEAVLVPFPGAAPRLNPADLPETYRWLRATPPGTVALGVPMGDWVNVAASALHLRRTVNGWSSFEPPRYGDLVAAMEAFPDPRTLALVRGLGTDVVLIDRAWLTPARATRLAEPGTGLRPERVFPTHVVYRVIDRLPPESATLRVAARLDGGRACVILLNPGPGWVPLYPGRRLTVAPRDIEADGRTSVTWLPLDLAPGTEHVMCLRPGSGDGLVGTIEGGDRRLRFAVRAGEPATALEEVRP
jgi:hypothetical protein